MLIVPLIAGALSGPVPGRRPHEASAGRDLVQSVGPIVLEPGEMRRLEPVRFAAPRDGWIGGYQIVLLDSSGAVLPPTLMHHAELIDPGRRDLFRDRIMRIASISHDTPELLLPDAIGYPVRRGHTLLVAPMLMNRLDHPVTLTVRITLRFQPARAGSEVTSVATFNFNTPGRTAFDTEFDLPPGRSEHAAEFAMPIGARLLGVSGHLHALGRRLTLVRLDTGDTLFDWRPPAGVAGSDAPAPAVRLWKSGGLHLREGTRLRLTAVYENGTGRVIEAGGMATAGGVLLPDDWRRWPALDFRDPMILADKDSIAAMGSMAGMPGMRMN